MYIKVGGPVFQTSKRRGERTWRSGNLFWLFLNWIWG